MKQIKITTQITARDSIALEKYLQDINRLPLLNPDEEVPLAARIKQGDKIALNELIQANLRFVVSVAKQYQGQGLPLNDLINEGNIGLIKAAERFDETKGFKFISYAVWWIRQAIMQSLMEYARTIRLPLNKIETHQKIGKAAIKFAQEHQREPNPEELAEQTGMTTKEITDMLILNHKVVSINEPLDEQDDSSPILADRLTEMGSKPDDVLIQESLNSDLRDFIKKTLDEREKNIIENYFGLYGNEALSLEDIATKFSLTRERVRQIKERAIKRLRHSSKSLELKKYI